MVRPSTGEERHVFQEQVCEFSRWAHVECDLFVALNSVFLTVRSSSGMTSLTKPSLFACMASSPWWGLSRECLIRRRPSTKPASTLCCVLTDQLTLPSSPWVMYKNTSKNSTSTNEHMSIYRCPEISAENDHMWNF